MARKVGQAGKSTREMSARRRRTALIIFIVGIVFISILYLILKNAKALGIGGIGILVLLFLIRFIIPDLVESKVDRTLKTEKRALRGAIAEERISETLDELNEDYNVLHDIESPYGNIDHIVISKHNGIFLIETKSHRGKVESSGNELLVNGKQPEKNFIVQILQNVYWLRDEIDQKLGIKPWITPVIVFTNAFVYPVKPIKGISVVNKKIYQPFYNVKSNLRTQTRKFGNVEKGSAILWCRVEELW